MGARALANQGIPCIGLPGTIDNDIACSEYTIGYDTAMNTAVEAIDKLRDTTQSHDRCSVVEVMGHHAGYIALNVGIATGAVAVLLPEIPFDFERDILERMRQTQVTGKKHFIIIVSEALSVRRNWPTRSRRPPALTPVQPFWATSSAAAPRRSVTA